MTDFTMPSLGADMEEGTLLEWLVKPGDVLKKGDLVAVVDTSKSAVEIETFHDATVTALLVEPGTTVAVGTPIATFDTPAVVEEVGERPAVVEEVGERPAVVEEVGAADRLETTTPAVPAQPTPTVAEEREPTVVEEREARLETTAPRGEIQISPYARRLADKLGVDVEPLWQRLGRPIKEADIRAAASTVVEPVETPVVEPVETSESRADRMRATIANLMARSKREIPHYYLQETVDLEPALAWMHGQNRKLSVSDRLVPAALMLKASALAVAETPELNGFWIDGQFRPADTVNLGVAVSLRGGGLVAPAILDAPSLSVTELMAAMKDLVQRARAGRLRGRELTEGTITVTNLGEQGVELVHGVIYPPQVALIGFGRPTLRPWIVGGGMAPRTVTDLTLAADHRATDGFVGSRLLARIAQHLQQPEQL